MTEVGPKEADAQRRVWRVNCGVRRLERAVRPLQRHEQAAPRAATALLCGTNSIPSLLYSNGMTKQYVKRRPSRRGSALGRSQEQGEIALNDVKRVSVMACSATAPF